MPFREGFASEIVGRKVVLDERVIGRVTDFLIAHPDDAFPPIEGLVVKTRDGARFAPSSTVADVDAGGRVVLRSAPTEPAPLDSEALYVVADLLDKQIVDVDGRKVVRINDLEVANTGGTLRVVAADVGLSGLLRRLGMKWMYKRIPRAMITWNNVAPVRSKNPAEVRLSVSEKKLSRLHPSELAHVIGELSSQDAAAIFHTLDDETAADALEHLDSEKQRSIIEGIGNERAADIIEEMDSDDAADLLGDLPEQRQSEIFAEMNAYQAGELRQLVKYDDNTAGGLMTTDYVWIYPHRSIEATLAKLREIAPETEFIYYLYVTDEADHLLGVVSLRALLLADPETSVHAIMETDLVTVSPQTSSDDVAATIAQYDLLAAPVVEDGKMLGIVTVDDAIDAIVPERFAKRLPRFHAHHHRPHQAQPA